MVFCREWMSWVEFKIYEKAIPEPLGDGVAAARVVPSPCTIPPEYPNFSAVGTYVLVLSLGRTLKMVDMPRI